MIVDDDASLRRALQRRIALMGYDVAERGDPATAMRDILQTPPDCLILDLAMPGMGGLDLQHAIHEQGCVTPTIFLSGHGDIPTTVAAMRDGAIDFLEKPVEDEALAEAISRALAQSAAEAERRAESDALAQRVASLTQRQQEVFLAVLTGAPNKVIAYQLGVSERTVKAHRSEVMEKLDVHSVAELALLAARLGLAPT
jgi:FixJ family two-component response regulator